MSEKKIIVVDTNYTYYPEGKDVNLDVNTYDSAEDFLRENISSLETTLSLLGYYKKLPNGIKPVELEDFMIVNSGVGGFSSCSISNINSEKINIGDARNLVNGTAYIVRKIDPNSVCPSLMEKAKLKIKHEEEAKEIREEQKRLKKLEVAKKKIEKLENSLKKVK